MISASLKNYRISPRKVRIVADMIRGKKVLEARSILTHAEKKAKHSLGELVDSAIANAKNNFKLDSDALFVKEIRVDQGFVLKRHMPVSRGRSHPISKRTSHVHLVLAPIDNAKPKATKSKAKKA